MGSEAPAYRDERGADAPARAAIADRARLAALDDCGIVDTPRATDFDDVAALPSAICGTPTPVVNLIGDRRPGL